MANQTKQPSEDRDQQILRRLANIQHKVDSLELITVYAFRANPDLFYKSLKEIFPKGKRRVQVYLAANGNRSVNDIADLLSMKYQNVSRELEKLRRRGLVEVIEKEGNKVFWNKTALDSSIGISALLMKEHSLGKNGLPK